MKKELQFTCPIPTQADSTVTLAHGGGGRLMHKLIQDIFLSAFRDPALAEAHDGAVLDLGSERLAFTTDSFVVSPLFFPGGDIGSLAVHGTANDLAMCAAKPLFLSCGFILEEGLPIDSLRKAAQSMQQAAASAGIRIVTGDTKVVERGKGDGLYVNTAGIGKPMLAHAVGPAQVKPGDAIILSGGIAEHGAAVLSVREGLKFETQLRSDAACVWPQVHALIQAGVEIHCLRDLTRGGLATALNEIAQKAGLSIAVEEDAVPIRPEVEGACEIFGLDPFYMACEGRFAAFVPAKDRDKALAALKSVVSDQSPSLIGGVQKEPAGQVRLRTSIGVERVLDMLSGEQLPRIC